MVSYLRYVLHSLRIYSPKCVLERCVLCTEWVVLEECWPVFFAPDHYYEPEYCGDVFFQTTQSQTVGSFNPETVTNCVKNPSLTQKFDCVSGNTTILSTHHGRCPSPTPTPDDDGGGRDVDLCCVPTPDGFECCGTPVLIDV